MRTTAFRTIGERPDAGHIFIYLGPNPERFASRFLEFGTTVTQLTSGKG